MTLEEYIKLPFKERTGTAFLSLSDEDQYKALEIEWEEQNRKAEEAWNALSEEEKEHIYLEDKANPFYERISGVRMERRRGPDGKWIYEYVSSDEDWDY